MPNSNPSLSNYKSLSYNLKIVLLYSVLVIANADIAIAKELIFKERLKIVPELAAGMTYSDNIYLADRDEQDELITTVSPSLDMQFAFSPNARIFVIYSGFFDFYKDTDNFREDHHYGNTGFQFETAKGSSIEFGGWGQDSAEQPYAADDRSKDYYIGAFYIDLDLSLGAATNVVGGYQHSIRRFDDVIDRRDDYDRDSFVLGLVNSRNSLFPLLFEYRYMSQDNDQNDDRSDNQTNDFASELTSQAIFAGFKWGRERRLSGSLRAGYLWSDFDNEGAYDGWTTDTDLVYEIGGFTTTTFSAKRGVRESTRSARDTLDYYIYTGGGLTITYTRLDPVSLALSGAFETRDYRSANVSTNQREDVHFIGGITARYRIRDWISISLEYRYRRNDSSINSLDYTENRISANILLFSIDKIRKRGPSKSPGQIDYY